MAELVKDSEDTGAMNAEKLTNVVDGARREEHPKVRIDSVGDTTWMTKGLAVNKQAYYVALFNLTSEVWKQSRDPGLLNGLSAILKALKFKRRDDVTLSSNDLDVVEAFFEKGRDFSMQDAALLTALFRAPNNPFPAQFEHGVVEARRILVEKDLLERLPRASLPSFYIACHACLPEVQPNSPLSASSLESLKTAIPFMIACLGENGKDNNWQAQNAARITNVDEYMQLHACIADTLEEIANYPRDRQVNISEQFGGLLPRKSMDDLMNALSDAVDVHSSRDLFGQVAAVIAGQMASTMGEAADMVTELAQIHEKALGKKH